MDIFTYNPIISMTPQFLSLEAFYEFTLIHKDEVFCVDFVDVIDGCAFSVCWCVQAGNIITTSEWSQSPQ